VDVDLNFIISLEPRIKGVEQPAVILHIKQTCFGEVFAEGAVNSGMLSELQIARGEECLGDLEHRVIRAGGGKLRLACR
jgi:hypothetical protein